MHRDDLKVIWICIECKARFLFRSDVEDHKIKVGHSMTYKYDLLSGKLLDGIDV
jgi:hypothetical protein